MKAQITNIRNTSIKNKIKAEQSILERIQTRELNLYGHLLRMEDSRWSKKFISGHRTVGGEEQDLYHHGQTK